MLQAKIVHKVKRVRQEVLACKKLRRVDGQYVENEEGCDEHDDVVASPSRWKRWKKRFRRGMSKSNCVSWLLQQGFCWPIRNCCDLMKMRLRLTIGNEC